MRIIICFLASIMISVAVSGQGLRPNTCDSTILRPEEYERCQRDSIFEQNIILVTNFIIFIKTELLPKYYAKRKLITIPTELVTNLDKLRHIYDSTLDHKKSIFFKDADRNGKYVSPKSYVSTLLAMEVFSFYPDVNAILLNDIHVVLKPQTEYAKLKAFSALVDEIYTSIPATVLKEVEAIVRDFIRERKEYLKKVPLLMLQGSDEKNRLRNGVVDFLMWSR